MRRMEVIWHHGLQIMEADKAGQQTIKNCFLSSSGERVKKVTGLVDGVRMES